MGKSRSRDDRRIQYDDYGDDYGVNHMQSKQKRFEKRMRNLIRSKNVDRLMDIDDEEDFFSYRNCKY
jgi:hypothetical protein